MPRVSNIHNTISQLISNPDELRRLCQAIAGDSELLVLFERNKSANNIKSNNNISSLHLCDSAESVGKSLRVETANDCKWLTAVEIGRLVGRSAKWVKERKQYLYEENYRRSGNRNTWIFRENTISIFRDLKNMHV